ncbi:hypothetical protein WJX75_001189 [Coccomyxa subellipsoidea]|uniref:AP2/ERF domain-containing protein n=1 Tax=Coccomyxa subellipsoidea TaxID=248742 RepID=A0ABR2YBA1_9CHLO
MDEKVATGKPENGSTLTHAEELTIAEAAAAMQEQQKAMKAHLPIWKPQLRQQPTAAPRRSASETVRLRHDENIPLDTAPSADKPQQATEAGQTIKYSGVSLHRGNSSQRERWRATTSLAGGGQQHIGYYGDRKTAAKMYDEVVIATKGTEHFTNFDRSTYDVSALS